MILLMLALNSVICGLCVCRLMTMKNVLLRVKIQYVIGLVASAANGLAPLFFQQWPNGTALFFAAWVCYMMLSDSYQWKGGPPEAAVITPETKDEPAAQP
jgi:hypothetical protein